MDRQFVPIPEYLTALCVTDDGLYDVIANGECAFFVFDNQTDELHEPEYYTSMPGSGSGYADLILVPTVHCRECRQRMTVDNVQFQKTQEWTPLGIIQKHDFKYSCTCGARYRKQKGWYYERRCEQE